MLLTPLLAVVSASGMDQAQRQQDREAGGPGQAHGPASASAGGFMPLMRP